MTRHTGYLFFFFSLGARKIDRCTSGDDDGNAIESGTLHYLLIITFEFVGFTEVVSALFLGQVISVHHKNMHAALVLFIAVEAF